VALRDRKKARIGRRLEPGEFMARKGSLIHRQVLLDRITSRRDASIFLIATEGAKTEKAYFEGLLTEPFQRERVQLKVLPPLLSPGVLHRPEYSRGDWRVQR